MGRALWRFRRRFAGLDRNEDGFTLAELLISIAILGIISGVLAAAFVVSGRTTAQTSERFDESHDAQIASAYFATDVQGAQAITLDSCFHKDLDNPVEVVSFSGPDPATITSWLTTTVGSQNRVVRRSCNETGLTSDAPLIYFAAAAEPVLSCDGVLKSKGGCAPESTPGTVTVTFTDHNRVDDTDDFVYSLTGSRRAQPGTAEGSASPAAHVSLMALGPAPETSTVSGARVNVNGAIAVGSSMTHADGELVCLGIQFVGSFKGEGCNGGPSTQVAKPVGDPFAGLPECPAATGCPSASGPGDDLEAGTSPKGPGVYHNVTIDTPVTFPPGIYVITGLLDVQPGANGLDLAGVTLYFACTDYGIRESESCGPKSQGGSFNFGQTSDPGTPATVDLSPVTSGEYASTTQFPGISIFVDPKNPASSTFSSGTRVLGAVYAANAAINVTGGGTFKGGIVSKSFVVAGGLETIDIGG